jgi:hypothetical protein
MKHIKVFLNPCALLVFGLVWQTGSLAADAATAAGTIKTSRGTAQIERQGAKVPANVGSAVNVSDRIVTGADGAVGITLRDNTLLSAGPNSTLDLNKFVFDTTTHAGELNASVKRGTLAVVSGKIAKTSPESVLFNTPTISLGVRGTEFVIDAGKGVE